MVQLGLSQFKTQNLLHSSRRSGVQFEPYMGKKLSEKSQLLTDFYEVQQVTFEEKENKISKEVTRDLVFVSDLSEFLLFIWQV